MITVGELVNCLRRAPKAEVQVELETLTDAGILVDDVAPSAGRRARIVHSSRFTSDSGLELYERWVIFEPEGN